MADFSDHYSDDSFWEKLKNFATKAGCIVIKHALVLYYCLLDSDTPAWAKATIVAALGYFISPIDAIPDAIIGAGFTDDLGVLTLALATVEAHVKAEHTERAEEKLRSWFSGGCDEDKPAIEDKSAHDS